MTWAEAVKTWAGVAISYHQATQQVVGLIAQNFQTPHLYKLETNKNKIKRSIQEGIPELNALVQETDAYKDTRNQSLEQKAKMKQRANAFRRIELIYNRLGYEVTQVRFL